MGSRTPLRQAGARPCNAANDQTSSDREPLTSTPAALGSGSQVGPLSSVQQSVVGPCHPLLGIGRSSAPARAASGAGPSKRQRKERLPNWEKSEVLALIEAKRILNLEETSSVDGRDLMTPDTGKWNRISVDVMRAGFSTHERDAAACKSKWNQLIPEYKRLVDFFSRTGTNEEYYWSMTPAEKKKEVLPPSFAEDIFRRIHEWYGRRPNMLPPHTRDALAGEDTNLLIEGNVNNPTASHGCSADVDEESLERDVRVEDSDDQSASMQSPTTALAAAKRFMVQGLPPLSPALPTSAATKSCIPVGVTPQIISSSDTAEATGHRRSGSTGIRRKSLSGHSLIAEATRATGELMSAHMKEMAEASREMERSKIDVQLKLFSEQMNYQRERDRRLHETAKQANDNAKLSIEKQGEVVLCLSKLASVLSGKGSTDEQSPSASRLRPVPAEHGGPSDRSDVREACAAPVTDMAVDDEDL